MGIIRNIINKTKELNKENLTLKARVRLLETRLNTIDSQAQTPNYGITAPKLTKTLDTNNIWMGEKGVNSYANMAKLDVFYDANRDKWHSGIWRIVNDNAVFEGGEGEDVVSMQLISRDDSDLWGIFSVDDYGNIGLKASGGVVYLNENSFTIWKGTPSYELFHVDMSSEGMLIKGDIWTENGRYGIGVEGGKTADIVVTTPTGTTTLKIRGGIIVE